VDNNTITDNTSAGGITMDGGAGNDTYIVKAGDSITDAAGTDTVIASTTFDLSTSATTVENLTLSGIGNINGTGNALDNIITGNAGANVLSGGLGNDTYYVGAGDTVIENVNSGTDTIVSSIDWSLATTSVNVENLTMVGAAVTGTGDAGNNVITGNNNNNIIDGGVGADTMIGGNGNDTYYVDNVGDVVVEGAGKGSGIDTVISSVSYTLSANVENLTLRAGAGNIDGAGNGLANTIIGNEGNNVITGGAASDTLTGGLGSDTFVLNSAATADKITDFTSGTDFMKISMAGIHIGNGDTVLDTTVNAVQTVSASGTTGSNFDAASELVIFTYNAANSTSAQYGTQAAALEIGHAASSFAIGDTRLFVVNDGTSSAMYLFTSNGADATVSANELTLLATLNNAASTTVADYGFVA
jgi:Ca2+-binding RTX toxin-like protein